MSESLDFYALAAGIGLFVLGWLIVIWGGLRRGLFSFLLSLIPGLNLLLVTRAWGQAVVRNGFLLSVIGVLLGGVGYYGGGERELLAHLEEAGVEPSQIELPVELQVELPVEVPIKVDIQRPHEVEVPNQAEAEAAGVDLNRSVLDEPPIGTREVEALPPRDSINVMARQVEYRFEPTCPALLPEDIGRRVRVLLREGGVREGTLVAASEIAMSVQQKMSGGDVAFEYPYDQIQSLEVYDVAGRRPTRASRCIRNATETAAPPVVPAPAAVAPPG
jgi:hypothetical protein